MIGLKLIAAWSLVIAPWSMATVEDDLLHFIEHCEERKGRAELRISQTLVAQDGEQYQIATVQCHRIEPEPKEST